LLPFNAVSAQTAWEAAIPNLYFPGGAHLMRCTERISGDRHLPETTPGSPGLCNWRNVIMSKQAIRKPLSIALGVAVVTSLGLAGVANANTSEKDIFSMEELNSGYLTAGGHEAKPEGEGNCGEDKDAGEGNCGEDKKKEGEGKCGEGKCGGES
jgi:uncharacterized low-complexity protein